MKNKEKRVYKGMVDVDEIKLYENKQICSVWNEEQKEWYFSVVDVVGVLSESKNPTDYLKKMRKRDEQLAFYLGTNCPQIEMKSSNGKKRKIFSVLFSPFHLLKQNPSSYG